MDAGALPSDSRTRSTSKTNTTSLKNRLLRDGSAATTRDLETLRDEVRAVETKQKELQAWTEQQISNRLAGVEEHYQSLCSALEDQFNVAKDARDPFPQDSQVLEDSHAHHHHRVHHKWLAMEDNSASAPALGFWAPKVRPMPASTDVKKLTDLCKQVQLLEERTSDAADKHRYAIEAVRQNIEGLHAKMADNASELCSKLEGKINSHSSALDEIWQMHDGWKENCSTLDQRIAHLETMLADNFTKHAHEIEDIRSSCSTLQGGISSVANGKIAELHSNLLQLESRHDALHTELKTTHQSLSGDKTALDAQQSSLKDRVDHLESLILDSADKHSKATDSTNARLDVMHSRVALCEGRSSAIDDLKASYASLCSEKSALDMHHEALVERVGNLEGTVRGAAESHQKDYHDLEAAHVTALDDIKVSLGKVQDEIEQQNKTREADHADLDQRLCTLEDSYSEQEAVLEKFVDLEELQAAHGFTEQALSAVQDQIKQENERWDTRHSDLQQHLNSLTQTMDELDNNLKQEGDDIRAALSGVQDQIKQESESRDAYHSVFRERLKATEQNVEETLQKHKEHAKAVEDLQALHGKLSNFADQQQLLEMKAESATAFDAIKMTMAEVEDHIRRESGQQLLEMKAESATAFDAIKMTMAEVEDHIRRESEQQLLEMKAESATAFDAIKMTMAEVKDHIRRESDDIKATLSAVQVQIQQESENRNADHSVLQQRLESTERTLDDNAQKRETHAKALEDLQVLHGKLSEDLSVSEAGRATLIEDVQASTRKLIDDLSDQETRNKTILAEGINKEVEDLKHNHSMTSEEVKVLERHHDGVRQRLDRLEQAVGASAEKHEKDLQALRVSHEKTLEDTCMKFNRVTEQVQKTEDSCEMQSSGILDRLDSLEKTFEDSCGKYAQQAESLEILHSDIDKLRVTHDETAAVVDGLSVLEQDRAAAVQSRLSCLETALADSAEKHERHIKHLQDVKSLQSRLNNDISTREASGAALAERLESSITALRDTQRLASALEKSWSAMNTRMEHLEKAASTSAQLSGERGRDEVVVEKQKEDSMLLQKQYAALVERVSGLDDAVADVAGRLDRELARARADTERLESNLAEQSVAHEKHEILVRELLNHQNAAREDHHASAQADLVERLSGLDNAVADVAGRLDRELASARADTERLESNLAEQSVAHEKHEILVRELLDHQNAAREDHHTSAPADLVERLSGLDNAVADVAGKLGQELASARADTERLVSTIAEQQLAHEKHGILMRELLDQKNAVQENQHASTPADLVERLSGLDEAVVDLAGRLERELASTRTDLERLEKNLAEQSMAHEKHGILVRELLDQEKGAREEHHASTQALLEQLSACSALLARFVLGADHEQLLADCGGNWTKINEEDLLRRLHGEKGTQSSSSPSVLETTARQQEHADIADKALGDLADRLTKELAMVRQKMEQQEGSLSDQHLAHEKHVILTRELLDREKVARESHHSSLQTRLDQLEKLLESRCDEHGKDLQSQRADHEKSQLELKTLTALHEALQEKLTGFEAVAQSAGEHFDASSNALQQADGSIAKVEARLAVLELESDFHRNLRDQLDALQSRCDGFDTKNAQESDFRDQVDALQTRFDGLEAKQAKEIDFVNALQTRFDSLEAKHAKELANANLLLENDKQLSATRLDALAEQLQSSAKSTCEALERSTAAQLATQAQEIDETKKQLLEQLAHAEQQEALAELVEVLKKEQAEVNQRIWESIQNHTHDSATELHTAGSGGKLDESSIGSPESKNFDFSESYVQRQEALSQSKDQDLMPRFLQPSATVRTNGFSPSPRAAQLSPAVPATLLTPRSVITEDGVCGGGDSVKVKSLHSSASLPADLQSPLRPRAMTAHPHDRATELPGMQQFLPRSSSSSTLGHQLSPTSPPATSPSFPRPTAVPMGTQQRSPSREQLGTPRPRAATGGVETLPKDTINCTNCGSVYMADALFCRKCGNKRNISSLATAPLPASLPVGEAIPATVMATPVPQSSSSSPMSPASVSVSAGRPRLLTSPAVAGSPDSSFASCATLEESPSLSASAAAKSLRDGGSSPASSTRGSLKTGRPRNPFGVEKAQATVPGRSVPSRKSIS